MAFPPTAPHITKNTHARSSHFYLANTSRDNDFTAESIKAHARAGACTKEGDLMRKAMTMTTMLLMTSTLLTAGCVVRREREVVTTTRSPIVQHDIVVQRPSMPAPRVEVRTVPPSPTYHWVEGHWEWNGDDWEWSSGYWTP
jgi:hypothetical protein